MWDFVTSLSKAVFGKPSPEEADTSQIVNDSTTKGTGEKSEKSKPVAPKHQPRRGQPSGRVQGRRDELPYRPNGRPREWEDAQLPFFSRGYPFYRQQQRLLPGRPPFYWHWNQSRQASGFATGFNQLSPAQQTVDAWQENGVQYLNRHRWHSHRREHKTKRPPGKVNHTKLKDVIRPSSTVTDGKSTTIEKTDGKIVVKLKPKVASSSSVHENANAGNTSTASVSPERKPGASVSSEMLDTFKKDDTNDYKKAAVKCGSIGEENELAGCNITKETGIRDDTNLTATGIDTDWVEHYLKMTSNMTTLQDDKQKPHVIGTKKGQKDNMTVSADPGECQGKWTSWRDCEKGGAVCQRQQRESRKAKRQATITSRLKAKEQLQKEYDNVCSHLGLLSIDATSTSSVCKDGVQKGQDSPKCGWLSSLTNEEKQTEPTSVTTTADVQQDLQIYPGKCRNCPPIVGVWCCSDWGSYIKSRESAGRKETEGKQVQASLNQQCVRQADDMTEDSAETFEQVMENNELNVSSTSTEGSFHMNVLSEDEASFETLLMCHRGTDSSSSSSTSASSSSSQVAAKVADSSNTEAEDNKRKLSEGAHEQTEGVAPTHDADGSAQDFESCSSESDSVQRYDTTAGEKEKLTMLSADGIQSGRPINDSGLCQSESNTNSQQGNGSKISDRDENIPDDGSSNDLDLCLRESGSYQLEDNTESKQVHSSVSTETEGVEDDGPEKGFGLSCESGSNEANSHVGSKQTDVVNVMSNESISDDRSTQRPLCSSQPSGSSQEDYHLSQTSVSKSASYESTNSCLSSAGSSASGRTKAYPESDDAFEAGTRSCSDSTAYSGSNTSLSSLTSRSSASLSDDCTSLHTRQRRLAATSSSGASSDDGYGVNECSSDDEQTSHDATTRGCPGGAKNRLWTDEDDAWRRRRYNWFANGSRGRTPCGNEHSDNDLSDDEREDSVSTRECSSNETEAAVPTTQGNPHWKNIIRTEVDGKVVIKLLPKVDCDQDQPDEVDRTDDGGKKSKPAPKKFVFSSSGVLPTGMTSTNWTATGRAASPSAKTVTNHPMAMCQKKPRRRKKRSLTPNLPDKLTVISRGTHTQALTFQQRGGQCRVPLFTKFEVN